MRSKFTKEERKAITLRYFDSELPVITMAELAEAYKTSATTISNTLKYGSFDIYLQYLSKKDEGIPDEEIFTKLGINNALTFNSIKVYARKRFHIS